jgi:chaperone required for assembly of F1-ATPase
MKRFYKKTEVVPAAGGQGIALDGRLVKTAGKHDLIVPSLALATAVAAEWDAQHGEIRRERMPLTRLAGTTIDRNSTQREAVVRQIADYAETDLVCYRATHPPALAARQQAVWQPLIDWAVERYRAPLSVTTGVIPASQPAASLAAFAAVVAAHDDFSLTALHAATTTCGSLVIALALLDGRLDAAAAFAAAQLDESFQIEAWGEDKEQAERRAALAAEIAAAARFIELALAERGGARAYRSGYPPELESSAIRLATSVFKRGRSFSTTSQTSRRSTFSNRE